MDKVEMSKTPKNSDKLKLIKQEEEAFEDQHNKYETTSCGRRCKVLLFYGVLIGMLIILCYLILLGWQFYMEQLGSNETAPVFAMHGIPLLQNNDIINYITGDPSGSIEVNENKYKRSKKSTQIAKELKSKKDNVYKIEDNLLHEDETDLHKEKFLENSSDFEETLEKIIENEQIGSKTKNGRYVNNQNIQVIDMQKIRDHQITEDEDKLIINEDILEKIIEKEQIGSKVKDSSYVSNQEAKQVVNLQQIRDSETFKDEDKLIINNKILNKVEDLNPSSDLDSNVKSTIRNNMHRIYHITGKNKNLSLGIYCSIVLVSGILLIITFALCIRFLYKYIIVKMIRKHTRLEEVQEYEIIKRLNPLCISPSNPGTPVDKDLRFKIDREKFDMFCDIYK